MTDNLGALLHATTDAQVWAREFCRLNPEMDEELMISWFANALMCGHDHAYRKYSGTSYIHGLVEEKIKDCQVILEPFQGLKALLANQVDVPGEFNRIFMDNIEDLLRDEGSFACPPEVFLDAPTSSLAERLKGLVK